MLRRGGKPVHPGRQQGRQRRGRRPTSPALWSLGLGEPYPVSALHGRGSGDLLDAVLAALPDARAAGRGPDARAARAGWRWSAGRTSASPACSTGWRGRSGRSSTRSPAPPSTRSTSWSQIGGEDWLLVDTAGLRKRVGQASGTEYYASLRTAAAIDAAEVAVVLLDASEPISEQDQRIISMVVEAGRALVLAFNKWDLVDEDRRHAARPGRSSGSCGGCRGRCG